MIVDSHVHIWVHDPERYPWAPIGGYIPKQEAPVEALIDIMETNRVEGAVLVQPTPYGWDNRYLLDAAKNAPNKFRSVCLVDPMGSQNADEMKRLVEGHGANGFRVNWHLHPISTWQGNRFHEVFWKTAEELNIPICVQCTLEYMPLLAELSTRFPQVRVVIDHLARLEAAQGVSDARFVQLLRLAEHPNMHIKISGWNYCSKQTAPYADVLPFVHAVLESYGAQRCLWGSDFPFIRDHWEYCGILEYLQKKIGLSEIDQQWLLGKTARSLWW